MSKMVYSIENILVLMDFSKGFLKKRKKVELHISFQLNTDGVAVFKSSKYSI